jgi:hypothetical protein
VVRVHSMSVFYETDGTVKDEDVFAATVSDDAALTDLRFQVADINTASKKLWQIAGDTSDPGGYYYVAITF